MTPSTADSGSDGREFALSQVQPPNGDIEWQKQQRQQDQPGPQRGLDGGGREIVTEGILWSCRVELKAVSQLPGPLQQRQPFAGLWAVLWRVADDEARGCARDNRAAWAVSLGHPQQIGALR